MIRLTAGLAAVLSALAVLAVGALTGQSESQDLAPAMPRQEATLDGAGVAFVTSAVCADCHQEQHADWSQSHHRHALEHALEASVLGDFADSALARDGETLRFHREGGRYLVRAAGADGLETDFEVLFTFGWEPLQQYLIALPDGRLQALDVAWDTQQRRWLDLYPDQVATPGDPLHWTGLEMNWNYMCADCHSTGLVRGYDASADAFATTWAEETVGCEACHGAGGAHVAWATDGSLPAGFDPADLGLQVRFPAPAGGWVFAAGAPIAEWQGAPRDSPELAVCGPCHAHRRVLQAGAAPDAALLTAILPSLLEEGLYRPDGRQEAEVYILGSFLQSRMAAAGVICSDCHEPHSATLKAEGNALCTQCHEATVFDRVEHHRHAVGSEGAACVSCHMPADLYMQVDARRDHGFRVPGAALAAIPGVVDGCAACHDPAAAWATAEAAGWWSGEAAEAGTARATAIALGRAQGIGAAPGLAALAADPLQPPIFRASALALLGTNLQPSALAALLEGLASTDPLLRLGAVRATAALPLVERYRALAPLIGDPVKGVRLEVAARLSEVPLAQLPPAEAAPLAALFEEMLAVERLDLDRPESHYNIANHLAYQGEVFGAERAYRAALQRDPQFVPAYVNLAELQRAAGSESLAAGTLRRGLAQVPDAAALHHALGLTLHRQGDAPGALASLAEAARLQPAEPTYAYAHALALQAAGDLAGSLTVLRAALLQAPNDRRLLYALVFYLLEAGEPVAALAHARHLAALEPENPEIAELVRRLGG